MLDATKLTGRVILTGYGEPLVNPHFISMLRDLDDAGIWIGMSTNGIALTPAIARSLAQFKHLVHINVSIDSPDPAVYRDARGGDVRKPLAGAGYLMAAIDQPERVTVSSVLMKRNLASLVEMPAILSGLGVKRYTVQGLVDLNDDGLGQHPSDQDDADTHIGKIREACENGGIALSFERQALPVENAWREDGPASPERSRVCGVPWEIPFIDKDGLVYACCYASAWGGQSLGDLNQQSLVEIWEGGAFQAFRQQLLDGRLPVPCRDCNAIPMGEHMYRRYAATLRRERSTLDGKRRIIVVAENCGTATWDANTQVRIGTTRPRDGHSAYYRPTWIAPNRVTSFTESAVPPGGYATFSFEIQPSMLVTSEAFQIMVEYVGWLPGTTFEIQPRRGWRDVLAAAVRGEFLKPLYLRVRRYSVRKELKRMSGRYGRYRKARRSRTT